MSQLCTYYWAIAGTRHCCSINSLLSRYTMLVMDFNNEVIVGILNMRVYYFVRLAGKIPPFLSPAIYKATALHCHPIDSVED